MSSRIPLLSIATLLKRLANADLRPLLSAASHPPAVHHERTALTAGRTRMACLLLCALTVCWIAIDGADFAAPLWHKLAAVRLLAALAFAGVAVVPGLTRHLRRTGLIPWPVVLIPMAFFAVAAALFRWAAATGIDTGPLTLYAALPFALGIGLAIYPMTLLERLRTDTALLVTATAVVAFCPPLLGGEPLPRFAGRLALSCGLGAVAGLCQLRLLISLTRQAAYDGLTGAMVRHAGQDMLETEFARARRADAPLSLAFIDLDLFKDVNDRFGHDVGDEVLRNAARAIACCLRRQDTLIRWGGEEFLVVMPDTPLGGALVVLNRLAEHGLGVRPDASPQTASIGLAERRADGGRAADWEALVALTDERMYAAKRAGRNRSYAGGPQAPQIFIPLPTRALSLVP